MKYTSKRQSGMTVLGIFLILAMLGCFFVFGLTAFPLYNEYLTVKSAMKSVISQPPAKKKSIREIRKTFLRNAELNNVERFTDSSVKKLVTMKKSKDGKKNYLNVKYKAENKLFKNIFLMMKVNETMDLEGSDS